jgi:hypothetical protein
MRGTPSFQEDHISQVPALQLLQHLGYTYLRPQEVHLERKGKLSNALLEGILAEQLQKLNRVRYRGEEHRFTDASTQAAIQTLKDIPFDGLVRTSEQVYDPLSLGKALEQTLDSDTKSFTLQYIDWRNPANNVFHVAGEFEVERSGSKELCRPDVVLFVNGIPLGVIECKQPVQGPKDLLPQAISQHIRNQADEYIPKLFVLAHFWSVLRRMVRELADVLAELLFAFARVAGGVFGFGDAQDIAGRAEQAVIGDAVPWLGIVSGDRDFKADLGAVAEFPFRFEKLRVDQQGTGLNFVEFHRSNSSRL